MYAKDMKDGGTRPQLFFAYCVDVVTTIGEVFFSHCPREANKVVRELARVRFSNSLSCNWVDESPRFLLDSLINDLTIYGN
jgi:hypothetical protein